MALTRMDYYLSSIYELGGLENYIHEEDVYELLSFCHYNLRKYCCYFRL